MIHTQPEMHRGGKVVGKNQRAREGKLYISSHMCLCQVSYMQLACWWCTWQRADWILNSLQSPPEWFARHSRWEAEAWTHTFKHSHTSMLCRVFWLQLLKTYCSTLLNTGSALHCSQGVYITQVNFLPFIYLFSIFSDVCLHRRRIQSKTNKSFFSSQSIHKAALTLRLVVQVILRSTVFIILLLIPLCSTRLSNC